MDVDEEPPSSANTCSPESCRQFWISLSVFTFVCSILYVAASIVYSLYTMVVDMDEEAERQQVKIMGIFDTCNGLTFNIDEVRPNTLKLKWSDVPIMWQNLYVLGESGWNITADSEILLEPRGCHSTAIVWLPRYVI